MASPGVPKLKIETGSCSEPSPTQDRPLEVLVGCDANGGDIKVTNTTAGDDSGMYGDGCSSTGEQVEDLKGDERPVNEALQVPNVNDQHLPGEDRPVPQCSRSCCSSPSPMISRTVSIDGGRTHSVSTSSSNTNATSIDVEMDNTFPPCNCPFVEVRKMTEEAKEAVVEHYRDHATIYTHPDGQQIPLIRGWMRSTIDRDLEVGYTTAVYKIGRIAMEEGLGDWPTHRDGQPGCCYQDRFQPWMRALVYRTMMDACKGALFDIDHREGFSKQRPAFHLDIPNVINPTAARFPCLCKEAHTISIATNILEQTMTSLAPLISMLATRTPRTSRHAIHSRVWHRIYAQMQGAMCKAFDDITEDSEMAQDCAEWEMSHVQPWMTKTIRCHCEAAARAEHKALQWRARDMQIKHFQEWLEQLCSGDEADARMEKENAAQENGESHRRVQIGCNEDQQGSEM